MANRVMYEYKIPIHTIQTEWTLDDFMDSIEYLDLEQEKEQIIHKALENKSNPSSGTEIKIKV